MTLPVACLLLVLLTLILLIVVKTIRFTSKQEEIAPISPVEIDQQTVTERLSEAIRYRTVSTQNPDEFDPDPFLKFHDFLERSYPLVHRTMKRETINHYSLLYKWAGAEETLAPVVFLAHIDVVPVESGTEKDWHYGAYSGQVADGFVWGRGCMDMKSTLTAIMESAEELIQTGFKPNRTIYFALGHDEEIGGREGAAKIAETFRSRGIRAAFTLDEGAMFNKDLSPIKKHLAVIAIAEKGHVTLNVTAKSKGGHSSTPPAKTALGTLSKALNRLDSHQLPATLTGPAGQLFDTIGPEMPWQQKVLFANRWLFKGFILSRLKKQASTNAMVRTTMVPTIISGGTRENILPTTASAFINCRILPGNTVDQVLAHVKRAIADSDVTITKYGQAVNEATPVSSTDSFGYRAIRTAVYQLFPETVVTPGLEMGGTDSKHYASVADNCYRFSPFIYGPEDLPRIHGTNERIEIEGYLNMIRFYLQLLKQVAV